MANVFKTQRQVLLEMLNDYKGISQITLTPEDLKRDEVVKFHTVAAAISMVLSSVQRGLDDFFPQSASEEALEFSHIPARQLPERFAAQSSSGSIAFTGTGDDGTSIEVGTQVRRKVDGRIFVAIESGALLSGAAEVLFQSVLKGQDTDIDVVGDAFVLVTPIPGVASDCVNSSRFANGRDRETPGEMLARIEAHDRDEDTGGNLPAYEAFARAASPKVTSAKAIKNWNGVGTVKIVITAGTTDIAGAISAGEAIVRDPGTDLVTLVQAYIDSVNPTTDVATVAGPTSIAKNVTVSYKAYSSDTSTIGAIEAEITRLTKVFLFSAAPGATIYPTDLERLIDQSIGHLLKSRRVSDLGVSTPDYTIGSGNVLEDGTITVTGS